MHMNPCCDSWQLCHHYGQCWLPCETKITKCISFNHVQLFYWRIDNMFTKDGICTLIDVVIINLTWANLLPQSCASQELVTSNAAQAKERSYRNQDQFLLLAIRVFECTNMLMCFYMIVPISFGALKSQKTFIFLVWLLLSVKKIKSLCKDVNIFHLKSSNNHRPNSFPTSTPSGHTSFTTMDLLDGWFLTWKNTANLFQMISFWHKEILTPQVS